MVKRNVWTEIASLRESCELFLDFPAPDSEAENADGEEDERIIRHQVVGAVAMVQSSLNVLAAHIFGLYGDPREGGTE
ncbi:MAG: hypothetical protein Q7T33_04755 [Dehalococcoidia bacterium]|nr:hypothetical protein [Dehalococcoidia bacterium]